MVNLVITLLAILAGIVGLALAVAYGHIAVSLIKRGDGMSIAVAAAIGLAALYAFGRAIA